jgi:hypothetical protein
MKSNPMRVEKESSGSNVPGQSKTPALTQSACEEFDLSLLEDSLSKSPWERMQANDDALLFMESLQAAMQKRNAKP